MVIKSDAIKRIHICYCIQYQMCIRFFTADYNYYLGKIFYVHTLNPISADLNWLIIFGQTLIILTTANQKRRVARKDELRHKKISLASASCYCLDTLIFHNYEHQKKDTFEFCFPGLSGIYRNLSLLAQRMFEFHARVQK
jgi:hypothetical protein